MGLVVKHDGNTVLQYNMNGRKRYRYFRWNPGTYEFYLEAFNPEAGESERISNVVSYTLP